MTKNLRPARIGATLGMKLDDAEKRLQEALDNNKTLSNQLASANCEIARRANEETRLSGIISSLKEELFAKSIAFATAQGELRRVDHEDAERAEVVFINDMRTSKVQHDDGFEVNGPAVPIQRAVLKYHLDRAPVRTSLYETPSSITAAKPKHWVNQS